MATDLIFKDSTSTPDIAAHGRDALEQVRARLMAIDPSQIRPMNVDPSIAVGRVLGAVPAINALREQIVRECPAADVAAIDELKTRSLALAYAHSAYQVAVAPPEGFQEVLQEATDARGVLVLIAHGLVAVNLLKKEQLEVLNGGRGYNDTAEDLLALVAMIVEGWDRLQNRVPFTRSQLDRLQGVGERLMELQGVRELSPERASAAADIRARAFTLLDIGYDEARRVVSFVRWYDGDAEQIAPSLRTHSGGNDKTQDKSTTDTKEPTTTTTTSAPGTSPAKPADSATAAPTETKRVESAPSGLPRNNPFTA